MATTGVTTLAGIYNKSLWMRSFMKKPNGGRRPIPGNEQFDYSKENLIGMTFEDKSSFFLVPLVYPEIYTVFGANSNMKNCIKGMINYIAHMATGVSGFTQQTMTPTNAQMKTDFFRMPVFGNLTGPTETVNLQVPAELSGYFITEMTRHWLNAISDENSHVAHYNGIDTDFNNWSHSCAMAYVKPNKTWTRVHYGALLMLMVPTNIPMENFEATANENAVIPINMTFSCCVIDTRNVMVRAFCQELLTKYRNFIVIDSGLYGLEGQNGSRMSMLDSILSPSLIITEMTIGDTTSSYDYNIDTIKKAASAATSFDNTEVGTVKNMSTIGSIESNL